ncbi:phage holin family protein [Hufsiella ginkgonis]|uniref:Phage holin family protein n=1 Tax=Hufsiella ginkgonis TaxID=2695274 RepID=A0A7K1XT00_9SPHI|nr:phage holin family protein [Hufsiella ginkgonis]MXV14133.1 phage holin family protein [Hufsiella ginkgonis]
MPESYEPKEGIPQPEKQDLIALLKEYLTTRMELGRLTLIERLVVIIANVATDAFVVVAMILTFLFGSMTLGFYLGEQLQSTAAGFGIVSLIYFGLALIMYFIKDKYVEKYLINFMVKKIFRKKK